MSTTEPNSLAGLSIRIGQWGEWGYETLEMLFAELGIQPGDDLQAAVERVTGRDR